MFSPSYIGVVIIGLLHGLEPGHGWPVALLYSSTTSRPLVNSFISSGILSFAHLVSSVAVVVAYLLLRSVFDFSAPFLKYVAAAVLVIIAYRFLTEKVEDEQHGHTHENRAQVEHEHEHEHPAQGRHTHWHRHSKRVVLTLWGLATFAFVLGFAHEEEFALLALVTAGINPLMLMLFYAVSVAVALIGVTVVAVKAYETLQPKFKRYERYIPKVSGAVLLVMAIVIILGP